MKRFGSIAVIAVVAMLFASTADARPQYPKALSMKYPKAAEALKAKKCGACHGKVAFPTYDCQLCHVAEMH